MSEAWLKQQEEVWGRGDEFRRVVDSIHARNDSGPLEGDRLAEQLASTGAAPEEVARRLVDWSLHGMPNEGAYLRARHRFEAGLAQVVSALGPPGEPMSARGGRGLLWTVVNALLRGPSSLEREADGMTEDGVHYVNRRVTSNGMEVLSHGLGTTIRSLPGTMDGSGHGEGEQGRVPK